MFRNLKIKSKFSISFTILLFLFTVMSLYIISQIEVLTNLTVLMHKHPLTVSNAVSRVDADIVRIQNSMKEILYSENEEEYDFSLNEIQSYESKIYTDFEIISERFLGDKKLFYDTKAAFDSSKVIRNNVLTLILRNKTDSANKVMNTLYNSQILNTKIAMTKLSDFAKNKSDEFLSEANQTKEEVLLHIKVVLITYFLIAILLIYFSTKGITKPLYNIIKVVNKIKEGNLKVEIPITSNDEFADLSNSFNEMTYQLAHTRSELNDSLQNEKELNLLKTNFINMISHEYRTPLTVISTSLYILKASQETGNEKNFEKHFNRIQVSIQTLNNMISDVLFLMDNKDINNMADNKSAIELNSFIYDIIEECLARDNYRHNIKLTSENNSLNIFSNRNILKQTLQRLILNAQKYSDKNRDINIKLLTDKDYIHIQVIDQGIGISEEDQKLIFEPFFKSKENIGIKEGTGLGLALVKQFANSMQWEMKVESEINHGSTFTILIPRSS